MATREIPILNHTLNFDSGVYSDRLDNLLTLTNTKNQFGIFLPFPTGSDVGLEVSLAVPQEYVDTPVLVIRGVLSGTPANVLAFGAQQVSAAVSESIDTAYEAEDTASNSTWTGYVDEDYYEETITLTPSAAYNAGENVDLSFYRDDSADTTTFDFILLHLMFRFNDA